MLDNATYIAAELDPVTAYPDVNGKLHLTREDAIAANFAHDFHMGCMDVLENHDPKQRFTAMPVLVMADFVRTFIEKHPQMVRVVLGDRDAT